jgi:hypothetical protein
MQHISGKKSWLMWSRLFSHHKYGLKGSIMNDQIEQWFAEKTIFKHPSSLTSPPPPRFCGPLRSKVCIGDLGAAHVACLAGPIFTINLWQTDWLENKLFSFLCSSYFFWVGYCPGGGGGLGGHRSS